MKKYKAYLAGPFFNEEQLATVLKAKKILEDSGKVEVFSPYHNCFLPGNASNEDRKRVFNENVDNVASSDFVIALMDDKDSGTLFECGYAYGKTPIVYCAFNLEEKQFNLMLAQSGVRVITSYDELKKFVYNLRMNETEDFKEVEYEGDIL